MQTPGRSSSTPIRAITSKVSTRSAPPLPPASQTYEPLVKAILRHRLLYNIFLWSLFSAWVLTAWWSTWCQGRVEILSAVGNVLAPKTLAFTLATWMSAVLPAVVLRNRYMTVIPTVAPSPSKTFRNALAKRSTSHALLTYINSAISLGIIHVLMNYTYESAASGSPRLTLFVKSKKHPYYLNGAVLYLFWSQTTLALAYLLRDILLDRFAIRWPDSWTAVNHQMQSFRLAHILTSSVTLLLFTMFCTVGNIALFGLSRSVVLPLLYTLPIVPRILRPFSAHFLRGSWTLLLLPRHFSLVIRTFYLGLTTVAFWEFAESSYHEAIHVSHNTADPALTLVSGITSSNPYFKHLAYAELKQLAREDSPAASTRRSALFEDQKYYPNMWSCLVRDALLTLGEDYQLLLRRGKPAPPPVAAPVPSKPAVAPPIPATPLIRAPILKSSPASPLRAALDTLASDGPFSTVAASTEAGASQIPELFRSVFPAQPARDSASRVVKKGEEKILGMFEPVKALWKRRLSATLHPTAPQAVVGALVQVGDWWTRERVNRVAEMSLPNRRLDALIVDVLCHLTCASLTEDLFGVVQRDIPKIIEAILSFLTALEEYQMELNKLYIPPSPEEHDNLSAKELAAKARLAEEVARAGDVLSEVTDVLKDGIVEIVKTFGEKLEAFKFPPRISWKLQGFVDYI
ncbi:nucleoporin protein Ndc1-Nup [Sparassis latifolia]